MLSSCPGRQNEKNEMNRFEQEDGLDLGWQTDGNCLGMNPDLFFPDTAEEEALGLAACEGCEVRVECYDHAIITGQKRGIWGGHNFGDIAETPVRL
jgi:hypothetical protein